MSGNPKAVSVEHAEEDGRSDIRIETDRGVGVIEAKVAAVDSSDQAARYAARWRVCLTRYTNAAGTGHRRGLTFMQWEHLAPMLHSLTDSRRHDVRFVAEDLLRYLQEHHMIRKHEPVEIYARELNGESTVNLFLHGQVYGCWHEKNSRLPEAMYFAPHFGQAIAKQIPGIQPGISYIARIKTIEVVSTWVEFERAVCASHGRAAWKRLVHVYMPIRSAYEWKAGMRLRSFLMLDMPRLVFNPPVKKDSLQGGKGWLSRRFLTFDDLFAAWKG